MVILRSLFGSVLVGSCEVSTIFLRPWFPFYDGRLRSIIFELSPSAD